jgi:hypothetical protein
MGGVNLRDFDGLALSLRLNPPSHPPAIDPLKGLIRVRMSGVVPSKAKSTNQHLTRLTINCKIHIPMSIAVPTASLRLLANSIRLVERISRGFQRYRTYGAPLLVTGLSCCSIYQSPVALD